MVDFMGLQVIALDPFLERIYVSSGIYNICILHDLLLGHDNRSNESIKE